MKILMVHPHDLWYDPWTIRILELARRVARRGHTVILCHLPRKEPPPFPPLRQPLPNDPPIYPLLPKQIHLISNFRLLYRLARSCDILHLQKCFASVSLPLLWISRLLNKPLHYDWDDDETAIAQIVESRRFSRLQLAVYERLLPAFASTLTYSSEALRRRAIQYGFPEERMRHLPVGADLQRFRPRKSIPKQQVSFGLDPHQLTVLYIGQMEGAAHPHLLIEAAAQVLSQYSSIQFMLAGGGEQLEAVRTAAFASPARKQLIVPGYFPAEWIPQLVAAADICVACFEDTPATRAKSPLKIAEYLAAGKPIVASRVGEVPAMIQACGILVEPGDRSALADGILQYANDPEKRRQDGLRARRQAEDFYNWDRATQTLLEAYRLNFDPMS